MDAFWLSLVMIFLAELGDKTQLVALTLATCYNTKTVLWGIFWATLGVHVFSAGIGWFLGDRLPADWIAFTAGIAFVVFGFWTLRGDHLDDGEEENCRRTLHPFWLVFTTFFMAELGDKTMLSTVTLAANNAFLPVWIGSTVGMVLSDGLAIVAGKMLGRQLPEKAIQTGAAIVFFLFGAFSMYQGGAAFPLHIWAVAFAVLLVAAWFFFRKPRPAASN
jgi:putative Ca2+/H+ antiporter (TMEM165/GDT1 family)